MEISNFHPLFLHPKNEWKHNLMALHLILVQKYLLLVIFVYKVVKSSFVVDVLSLDIPSSSTSFLGLERSPFTIAFLDPNMLSTFAIAFFNSRTLLGTFDVIVPCLVSLLVVDFGFDVVRDFILC
jgi:hypothetical protein